MASMRDIKRRKETIHSTGQITKAMKLVSTVKLQKAKLRAERSKAYFDHMYTAVCHMLAKSEAINHPFLQPGQSEKKAVIVITSNRGLAGGYNSNVTKLLTGGAAGQVLPYGVFAKEDTVIYAVGKKGREILSRKGYTIAKDYSDAINAPIFKDAAEIGKDVLTSFINGEIGEIYLAYTMFKNTVTHIPTLLKLLPVDRNNPNVMEGSDASADQQENADQKSGKNLDDLTLMNYEPEAEEALDMIIPKYVNSLIYGGLVTAIASENGARMQAMDSATSNAEDIISELELKYNRARQGTITQEITEIVAGASAIS